MTDCLRISCEHDQAVSARMRHHWYFRRNYTYCPAASEFRLLHGMSVLTVHSNLLDSSTSRHLIAISVSTADGREYDFDGGRTSDCAFMNVACHSRAPRLTAAWLLALYA
jgi:hypothetical protein